jgi:DNA mismatch repair protein MutS
MNSYIKKYTEKISQDLLNPKSPEELFNSNNLSNQETTDIINEIIPLKSNNIMSNNILKDINIFSEHESVFDRLNNTKLISGKQHLKNIVMNPLKDIEKLQDRQNILKNLGDKTQVNLELLHKKIDDISFNEKNIYWFWKNMNPETLYLLDSVYFSNKYLKRFNSNESILNITSLFKIVVAPIYGLLQPVIMIIMPYLYLRFFTNVRIKFSVYFRLVRFSFFNVNPLASLNPTSTTTRRSKFSKILSTVLSIMFYIQGVYSSIESSRFTNSILNEIHKLLNKVKSFINQIKSVNSMLQPILGSSPLPNIFEGLNDRMFDNEPFLLSNKGKILITFNEIRSNKDKLLPYLEYISYVDSILSIHKLSNEYSWSKFTKSKSPEINIKNMWNPLIGKNESVKNNIEIGNSNPNNIILTGPNAGGKTTFIKSVCLQVLLSQTLTISSSDSIKITPFSIIGSHMNISDNLGKDSLFESEMNRAKSYLNTLKRLNKKSFAFIVMDEIFSSTNPEEGMSGGYAIGEQLGRFNNSVSIITTHFNFLTKLEKTKLYKNYKITVEKKGMEIKYPYKIEEGASKQYIALELLSKKGFDKEIIERAIDVRSEIVSKRIRSSKKTPKLKKKDNNTIEKKVEEKVDKNINTNVEKIDG